MLDPLAGDAFRGKLWTAEWPALGKLGGADNRMRVGDVLRCLEGVPCRIEWGNGEMVAFWYAYGGGGNHPVEIRRRFVLPPPPPEEKEAVVDWGSWVDERKIDEGTAEEEQGGGGGGGIKVFDDFEDSRGLPPSNFYLTPPPEGSRHADWTSTASAADVAQGSSDAVPPPPSSRHPSSSTNHSDSQDSSATSLGYGYVEEWEMDDGLIGTTRFFMRSSSKSPSPEFDYTMDISEAFAFWQDPSLSL